MSAKEIAAIMGSSGSGKSTFLKTLGFLLQPTAGSCSIVGKDVFGLEKKAQVAFRRQRLGFVFQACDLLPNSLVYENSEMPLIYAKVPRMKRPDRILAALEKVNLGHRIYHQANQLSGGEQQQLQYPCSS